MPEPKTRENRQPTDTSHSSTGYIQPVNPMRGSETSPGKVIAWKQVSEQEVDDVTARASQALDEVGQRVSAAYERVQTSVADAYERGKWKSQQLARTASARARFVVDEYPLHVIAGFAGAAFVAGIVLRVWRSNRDE